MMDLAAPFQESRTWLLTRTLLPEVFAGRGLTLEQLRRLNDLGLDADGNAVIALRDVQGHLLGLKLQLLAPGSHKYLEQPNPNDNPPWFAPGSAQVSPTSHRGVLCIEGELNAMVSMLALEGSTQADGCWAVIGLSSTFGPVPWDWLNSSARQVVFSVDRGRAGDKSVRGWLEQARSRGLHARRAKPPLHRWDAREVAERCGLETLARRWLQILNRNCQPRGQILRRRSVLIQQRPLDQMWTMATSAGWSPPPCSGQPGGRRLSSRLTIPSTSTSRAVPATDKAASGIHTMFGRTPASVPAALSSIRLSVTCPRARRARAYALSGGREDRRMPKV